MKKFLSIIFIIFVSVILSFAANIDELKKAAEQGDAQAQCNLGICYDLGKGVEKNPTEAVKWYRKAAEQGIAEAQFFLGACYDLGNGVEKNLSEAVKWYRKAAEQGNAPAQYNLGICYDFGKGVEKNPTEAVKWYRKAAEQGIAPAQCNLGICYANGDGVEKNPTEAVKWYRKAAEQGIAEAQFFLGACYDLGNGVEKNLREAVKWYRKAAEQGIAPAQCNLGDCYAFGKGVEKNLSEAVKWYRKAAEQGDATAQYNLGICYYKGTGMIQNNIKAYAWIAVASANGYDDATKVLQLLKEEMTPLQVEKAVNLAENYSKGIFNETPKKANATKTGSGFAITANGYIVTNCHVVEDSSKITLVRGGLEYPATIVAVDESNDIAILKISSSTIPLPLITSRKTKIGNAVYSMGFPNVQLQGLSPKFTSGLISSLTGLRDDPKHFQISVPIQPGNSGGALVDNRGNVIGVVTAKLSQKAAINTTGTIAENVNYALKSSYVLILLESLPEISDKLMDENSSEMPSNKIAEKLQNSTYFIIAQ